MDTISLSKAHAQLDVLFDKVNMENAAPIEIKRRGKPSAVLMGKHDCEGMFEMLYLLSSPANSARLLQGKADVEAGNYSIRHIAGVNID